MAAFLIIKGFAVIIFGTIIFAPENGAVSTDTLSNFNSKIGISPHNVDTCPNQGTPPPTISCSPFPSNLCPGAGYTLCESKGLETFAFCCDRYIPGSFFSCTHFCSACGLSARCFHEVRTPTQPTPTPAPSTSTTLTSSTSRPSLTSPGQTTCDEFCEQCNGTCFCNPGSRQCTETSAGNLVEATSLLVMGFMIVASKWTY